VKLLRADPTGHSFHLVRRERQLLLETISLYPLVPAAHHRLSQSQIPGQSEENQHLLEAALAEQRQENRRQVLSMLNDPQRFREIKSGFELTLTPAQMEWLLQVLNDVRVGCWLALGEPEPGEKPEVTEHNVKYLLAMELGGFFQSGLLAALGVSESPQWGSD
jgi:hypothetical protein